MRAFVNRSSAKLQLESIRTCISKLTYQESFLIKWRRQGGKGVHSTQVVFPLLTQQSRVRIPALLCSRTVEIMFIHSDFANAVSSKGQSYVLQKSGDLLPPPQNNPKLLRAPQLLN